MATTPTVLLLGGAGLPPWIWEPVSSELEARHICSISPPRPRTPGTSLADQADAVLAAAPAGPVALVAHSSGGVVAAEIVARHADRVSGILGLSALVPGPGRSFLDTVPLPGRLVLGLFVRVGRTRPPAAAIRAGVASGVERDVADRLVADLEPEPAGHFSDRTSARTWPEARAFVATTADRELPLDRQRASAAQVGVVAEDVVELATGHLPMLEEPDAVVSAVLALLEQVGEAPTRS